MLFLLLLEMLVVQSYCFFFVIQADAIQKIAAYVKKNPRASSDEQAKVIKKHLDDFAVKVALITGEC